MAFRKQRPPAGARPGSLAAPEGSPPPRLHVTQYSPDRIREAEITDPTTIRDWMTEDTVCWLNVRGLGDEEVLRKLAEIFEIHPLALEDAVNVPQRSKSELYEHHQLIISRLPLLDEEHNLTSPQVCFMIGTHYLITFQEKKLDLFDPVRERLRAGLGPIRKSGPDYLAYALIDTMVDRYYPVAEDLSNEVDDLDDIVTGHPEQDVSGDVQRIRRSLVVLRRVGWPQREMVNSIIREQSPFITDTVRQYFRDTNDHISQIMELVDSIREMNTGIFDVYQSNLNQRTNEIMKVLTLTASIFIPLTFIAGIYGMNFDNMPELHNPLGYFAVLLIMVVISAGMLFYFRRRGWLWVRRKDQEDERS